LRAILSPKLSIKKKPAASKSLSSLRETLRGSRPQEMKIFDVFTYPNWQALTRYNRR